MRAPRYAVILGLGLTLVVAGPLLATGSGLREAEKELKEAVRTQNLDAIDSAVQAVRHEGGKDAAELLVSWAKRMPAGADQLYWRFVNGAASLRDAEGLTEVGEVIAKGRGALARDLLYAMQNNRSQPVAQAVLQPALLDGDTDLALMAADQLALIEQVEAVDALIAGLEEHERKDTELKSRIERGLRHLTGADCGSSSNWKKWWEIARKDGVQGKERRSRSTGTVVDTFDGPDQDFKELTKLDKHEIWVMTSKCRGGNGCDFDDISALLDRMGIAHTNVTKGEFERGEKKLDGVIAVLLTCTQINEHCVCPACVPAGGPLTNRLDKCTGCDQHEVVSHKLKAEAVVKLREWVERGGYLFTEDWGVNDVLEPAWPKIVRGGKMLMSRSARVSPGRGQTSHPLLKNVFLDPSVAEESEGKDGATVSREPGEQDPIGQIERFWTIDNESPWIDIQARTGVTVLMASEDLIKDCGPNGNAVAVTFLPSAGAGGERGALEGNLERMRGGRVLHVLSHFAKQKSDQDAFALQNLLINFLSEANRRKQR